MFARLTHLALRVNCYVMTVEIPETIGRLLPMEPSQRMRSVMEGLVLGAYTQGIITRGRACELLGLNYWDGEKFFSGRGVFVNYDLGEFQHDLGN
jgi:predicted HTH domain antitoxin